MLFSISSTIHARPSAKQPDGDRPIASPQRTADLRGISQQLTDLWTGTLGWFREHSLELAIALLAGAVIVLILLGLRGLGQRLCRRDAVRTGWATIIGRVIARTSNLFIIAVAARLVVNFAEAPEAVSKTIAFLFIIIAVIQAAIWAREFILGFIEHKTQAGAHDALGSAMNIIRLLVSVVLFVLAAVVILDNLGVNVTGLVAGLGIGGIAIGLAAQGIFADLFAALSILFDRPFRRGDAIGYDDTAATVEAIGLKSTRLRSITGEQRVISNKNLLDKEIRNNSRLDHRRTKFAIGVIYQTDPARAAALPGLLREIVESCGQIFVRAGFVGFGASALDFEVEFDVVGPEFDTFFDARHAVGLAILTRFAEEKMEFAYPTQTTFTAAPDGTMIMPYAEARRAPAPPAPPRT